MRSIAHTGSTGDSVTRPSGRDLKGAFTRRVGRLTQALAVALKVRRERRLLLGMDDRTLKDVGFSHSEAHAEAQKSFWDIPVDRLRL